MRHPDSTPSETREFRIGDRVTLDRAQPGGNVVATFPIAGRDATLVVWRMPCGGFEMGEADQIHLVATVQPSKKLATSSELHDESEFAIRILAGRLFVNRIQHDHLIDADRREYTLTTTLRDSAELRRVVSNAFAAGEINARRAISKGAA